MTAQKHIIAVQGVNEELWGEIKAFLGRNPRMKSLSELGKVSLENYIVLAERFGLDSNWNINIPKHNEATKA